MALANGTLPALLRAMTAPRMVVPGVYLLTRNTIQGQYIFHPYTGGRLRNAGRRLRNQCGYLLGYYANKYDIDVGAANYYSNHTHAVMDDRHGALPDFQRDHNALLARYVRFLRRSKGAVWEPGTGTRVALTSPEAILDRIVYTLMQQVKDGVLRTVRQWDGFVTSPETLFEPQTFVKDEAFWRTEEEGGAMPDTVVLQPKPMSGLREVLGDRYQDIIIERCKQVEQRMSATPVLGRKAVRKIRWQYVPTTQRPVRKRVIRRARDGTEAPERFDHIRPRFTYRSRAEFREQAGRHKRFRRAYRERRTQWLNGDTTSPWPYGTFHMCRRLGAPQAIPD